MRWRRSRTGRRVAAALGGEDYILAKADEGFAEPRFGEGEDVVGGDIEGVDAALDGEMDGGLSLGGIGDAKGVPSGEAP